MTFTTAARTSVQSTAFDAVPMVPSISIAWTTLLKTTTVTSSVSLLNACKDASVC